MPAWNAVSTRQERAHAPYGGRLAATDGRELILRDVALRGDAGGGIARVVLEQRFENPYDEPLTLVYQLPLPAEGAVASFAFEIGESRVVGEIGRRAEARERFEEAILEGRTASILEQERSSLFTQEIGNVPPRTAVTAELTIDQRLRWLEGGWECRFPTVVAPRYLGAAGRVPDAGRVAIDVAEGGIQAQVSFVLAIGDALSPGGLPCSPSHAVTVAHDGSHPLVRLRADDGAALDRDVVVRWPVAVETLTTRLEVAQPVSGTPSSDSAYGLLTFVPPAAAEIDAACPRDLVVLLDASGSMSGAPFEQARRIASDLVGALGERDTLELIAFASEPCRFRGRAQRTTAALRSEALAWLAKLEAGGATEMDRAIATALAPLRDDAQRQVVLISDGLIGFEQEIVARVLRDLPVRTRLHTIGVGSSVNRSLTQAAARAGRGIEIVLGLDEDGRDAARRLLAHLDAPIVRDMAIAGSAVRACAPARLRDVTTGAPVLVSLELDPAGGEIEIRANGFEQAIPLAPVDRVATSPAVAALFAREMVEDLEARAAAGERVDEAIERIGLRFQIATRLTSWVAISEERTVDPTAPTRRKRIPHAIPHGMSVAGLGLRATAMPDLVVACMQPSEPLASTRQRLGFDVDRGNIRLLKREETSSAAMDERRTGRIVRRSETELVIEFEVEPGPLWWDPERAAALVPEGSMTTEIPMRIDLLASTAPGRIHGGLVIRVVLRLEQPLPAPPTAIAIETNDVRLIVDLQG